MLIILITLNPVQIPSLAANKRTVRSALTLCKSHLSCSVGTGGIVEVIPSFTSTAHLDSSTSLLPDEEAYWCTAQTTILILTLYLYYIICAAFLFLYKARLMCG